MKTCGKQIIIGGLYSGTTPPFFRGVLPNVSRCLKATVFDAAVLLLVKEVPEDDKP